MKRSFILCVFLSLVLIVTLAVYAADNSTWGKLKGMLKEKAASSLAKGAKPPQYHYTVTVDLPTFSCDLVTESPMNCYLYQFPNPPPCCPHYPDEIKALGNLPEDKDPMTFLVHVKHNQSYKGSQGTDSIAGVSISLYHPDATPTGFAVLNCWESLSPPVSDDDHTYRLWWDGWETYTDTEAHKGVEYKARPGDYTLRVFLYYWKGKYAWDIPDVQGSVLEFGVGPDVCDPSFTPVDCIPPPGCPF